MKRYIRSNTKEKQYTYDELSDRAKHLAEFCVYEELFTGDRVRDFINECTEYLKNALPGSDDFDFDFDLSGEMDSYFNYYADVPLSGLYNKIKKNLSKSCASVIKSALNKDDYRTNIEVGAAPRYSMNNDFLYDVDGIKDKYYKEFNNCAEEYVQNLADKLISMGYEYAHPWEFDDDKDALSKVCKEHNFMFEEDGNLI